VIDLHVHSSASDGVLRPQEVVELARYKGLSALALTDHDTLEGVEEARAAGERLGVTVVPGVEISLEFTGTADARKGSMHLLVYFAERGGAIDRQLEKLQQWRRQRIQRIVEKLTLLGMKLSLQDIETEAGGGQMGRPHLARVMVKRGYVNSAQEAFQKYLSRGAPAYVEKKRLTLEQALSLCARERVVPVLAHPYSLLLERDELVSQLTSMKSLGLKGVEVIYPEHDPDFRSQLSQLAKRLGLIITGGSDFHGDRPEPALGTGNNGNILVADSVLDSLVRARP
jgi:predicted metal-dependent phosphoesterase TrpH